MFSLLARSNKRRFIIAPEFERKVDFGIYGIFHFPIFPPRQRRSFSRLGPVSILLSPFSSSCTVLALTCFFDSTKQTIQPTLQSQTKFARE